MQSLIVTGVELAMFGMGTVFSFLVLLALAMGLMSKLVTYLESTSGAEHSDQQESLSIPNTDLVAIVTSAIAKHRQIQK